MIENKFKFTNYAEMESNNTYSNGENVATINLKLFHLFFFENCQHGVQDETSKFFLFGVFPSACKT